MDSNGRSSELTKSVVFFILVHYYQLAYLLHVKVEKQTSKHSILEEVKGNITNFYYFRLAVHVHEKLCPTFGLTFLQKSAINIGFYVSTLTNLLIFAILERILIWFGKKMGVTVSIVVVAITRLLTRFKMQVCQSRLIVWFRRRINGLQLFNFFNCDVHRLTRTVFHCAQSEEEDVERLVVEDWSMDGDEIVEETVSLENDGESKSNPVQEFQITFTVRLQLAFIKLLKTIYTPITDISFKLIHCISINNTMHLYAAGDVLCYQWWQVVIMVVVVPGLVVFPFSYGLAMCLK